MTIPNFLVKILKIACRSQLFLLVATSFFVLVLKTPLKVDVWFFLVLGFAALTLIQRFCIGFLFLKIKSTRVLGIFHLIVMIGIVIYLISAALAA